MSGPAMPYYEYISRCNRAKNKKLKKYYTLINPTAQEEKTCFLYRVISSFFLLCVKCA